MVEKRRLRQKGPWPKRNWRTTGKLGAAAPDILSAKRNTDSFLLKTHRRLFYSLAYKIRQTPRKDSKMVDTFRERLRHLPTWQTLRAQRKPLANVNAVHAASLSRLERIAVFVTERVGTMGFFLI